jgi:hypothetical protein
VTYPALSNGYLKAGKRALELGSLRVVRQVCQNHFDLVCVALADVQAGSQDQRGALVANKSEPAR